MRRVTPNTTEQTRGRSPRPFLTRPWARLTPNAAKPKRHARRFNRRILNLLGWLMMLVLILASTVDQSHVAAATQGFVTCTDERIFNSSADHLSPDQRSELERSLQQAACSPFSVQPPPKNIFQRLLELLEGCCGSCYICRP